MPDDDDDDIGMEPADEDPNNLEDLVGADMAIEVQEICNRAHTLLGAEVVGGYGAAEMQRVCLDIPKGLLLVAQYRGGTRAFQPAVGMDAGSLKDKGGKGRRCVRRCMSGWRNT